MLETKVGAFLERHSFSLKNKRIVVGVSGGPDSLALLYFLMKQKEKLQLSITAAHVDHMFRGEESSQDALFVKNYCEIHSIPFRMEQINVPGIMEQTGKSPESAGREARYGFFEKVMLETNSPYLALAHHGDDQIETILMRLTRGSTGRARAGIPFQRPLKYGLVFRPFLGLTKREIEQYCLEHQLEPRIDPSNKEDIYCRNRFRNTVLPFLKEENRQVHEHFQRFSEDIEGDERFLCDLTEESMKTVITSKNNQKITIDIGRFFEMPIPLQRRGIQLILNYLYDERPASLSAVHIDQLLNLMKNPHPSGTLDLPNGLKVIRSYRQCHFQFEFTHSQSYQYNLEVPGSIKLPGGGIIKAEYADSAVFSSNAEAAVFAPERVKLPLIVRTRKDGDRISLKGMAGSRKLKDIFIDQKIPIQDRKSWPVVTDQDGNIIWLPGLKKSAIEDSGTKTGHHIHITYTKSNF